MSAPRYRPLDGHERGAMRVYFIADEGMTRVKIGKALDLNERFASLLRSNPHPLLVLGSTHGYTRVEKWLHGRLGAYRLHGEWFVIDGEVSKVLVDVQRSGLKYAPRVCPAAYQSDCDSVYRKRFSVEAHIRSSDEYTEMLAAMTPAERARVQRATDHAERVLGLRS